MQSVQSSHHKHMQSRSRNACTCADAVLAYLHGKTTTMLVVIILRLRDKPITCVGSIDQY